MSVESVQSRYSAIPDYTRQTEAALLDLLYAQARKAMIATAISASLLAFGLWSILSLTHLLVWLTAMLSAISIRSVILYAYTHDEHAHQKTTRWGLAYDFAAFMTGTIWASAMLMVWQVNSPIHGIFTTMVLSGAAGAASASLSARLSAYYLFSSPIICGGILYFLSLQVDVSTALAILALLYGVFMVIAVRTHHISLRENLELRFKVGHLLSNVEVAKNQAESLNKDLEIERDRAEVANKAKSRFMANISHEMRTPMNGVHGMLGLLGNTQLNSKQKRYLEVANQSSTQMIKVLNDVLDASTLESGQLQLEHTEINIRTLITATVDLHRDRAEAKGLSLIAYIGRQVPDTLTGDPVRIQQILNNLLDNAVKFTEKGHIYVHTTVEPDSSNKTKEALRIDLGDTGVGIAHNKLETLFTAFTQADNSTTRQHGGTGLGLNIAKELALQMGGDVFATSTEGEGSVFTFTLKL